MTYEEKISWLSRYREAEKLYQRLSYRLAEAQEATRHITQNLSAAPGGSKDGQSLARAKWNRPKRFRNFFRMGPGTVRL